MIQGTINRIFNATSDCQPFDVAPKKNQIWTENQFPNELSSSIFKETSVEKVTKAKITAIPR